MRPGGDVSARAELIGIDWGTSNLRVMRIAGGGEVLDVRSDPRGAARLAPGHFSDVLHDVAGDWFDDGTPALVCGMAGARGKWREAAYRPCPAGLADLSPVCLGNDSQAILIVPGVALSQDGALEDVMRGEETQVMGLADAPGRRLVVTPGTHSKWIRVEDNAIQDFRTFMTGDLFAAIRTETVLGQDMGNPGIDMDAFQDGVSRALADDALTAALFSVRVERLSDRLAATSTADYLSGLLIGAEIRAQGPADGRSVTLIGAPALNTRYAAALAVAGFEDVHTLDGPTATARGLWRIHEAHRR
jgi:2-dehydro-3-deoxygalactonokinase